MKNEHFRTYKITFNQYVFISHPGLYASEKLFRQKFPQRKLLPTKDHCQLPITHYQLLITHFSFFI
ncbi:MAG: hypothetical protein DRR08_00725 [Candidatus Parabeggiatoa sp. nov. 2]|nr:MAG: hypothetical protein B6247_05120 [Beggiatoa sp. 4572_84]RKZ64449.1 MAG: hypothetical protein DRR08_00725 [Gammaproteobacteria bacterium]